MVANALVVFLGVIHVFFLVLEMFLWTRPYGLKRFAMTPEVAATTAPLAKNQGLYNGFLAAGLFWGAWEGAYPIKLFFVGCVVVAGLYGGLTTRRAILYIQALPGIIALVAVLAAH